MKHKGLYYASDKALYDALSPRKLKNSSIRELFVSRGILTSPKTEREKLAKYFSRLNHDFFDHQKIADVMGASRGRENSSVARIPFEIDGQALEKAIYSVKDTYSSRGDAVKVVAKKNGFEIEISYQNFDYNKSEFSQVVEKKSVIQVEMQDGETFVRWPANEYSVEVKEEIFDRLSQEVGKEFEVIEIDLTIYEEASSRTQFFVDLIEFVKGHQCIDVKAVHVYNPREDTEEEVPIHITKAQLKGDGVLNSPELKSMIKNGFYISRISWESVKMSDKEGTKYSLDALFSDPIDCVGFSYAVNGAFTKKPNGDYIKNRKQLAPTEERAMLRLLEQAAAEALRKLKG